MIRYYLGKPRSGKTYALVKDLHDIFLSPKSKNKKKYKYLYTNINGFRFDVFNEYFLNNPIDDDEEYDGYYIIKAIPLKWELLYKHLKKIEHIGDNDDKLIEYCKDHKLYNCYFAIDETHKYFAKEDSSLVWWLGYHGHMGHDISFVTQNLKKIHTKYKLDSEIFLEAQPKSKSVSQKQLRYKEYADDTLKPDQKTRSFSLMMKKDIHNLYKSGDVHKPKSVTLPLIGALIVFVLLMIFAFKMLFSNLSPVDDISEQTGIVQGDNEPKQSNLKALNPSDSVLFIRCSSSDCWNTNPKYQESSYSSAYVHKMMKIYGELLTELDRHTYNLIKHFNIGSKMTPIQTYVTYAYQIDSKTSKQLFPFFFIPVEQEKNNVSAFGSNSDSEAAPLMPEGQGGEA